MREENRKHGHKSSGRKHGGNRLKGAGKRRMAPKRVPAPPSLPAIAPPPTSVADRIEAPPIAAPPVETPPFVAAPIAASEAPLEGSRETEAPRKAAPVRAVMSRAEIAAIAFVVAAICGVALLRACGPNDTPTENDAAETGPCSDDASLCLARA
jgi:hypothetical protein